VSVKNQLCSDDDFDDDEDDDDNEMVWNAVRCGDWWRSDHWVVAVLVSTLDAVVAVQLPDIGVKVERVVINAIGCEWVVAADLLPPITSILTERSIDNDDAVVRCSAADGPSVLVDGITEVEVRFEDGVTLFSRWCNRVRLDGESKCLTLAKVPLLGAGSMPRMWQNIEYRLTVSKGAVLNCCRKSGPVA
jgi:hypothetical protein